MSQKGNEEVSRGPSLGKDVVTATVEKLMGANIIQAQEAKARTVRIASLLIDVLRGNSMVASRLESDPADQLSSAPNGIPGVMYTSYMPRNKGDEAPMSFSTVSDLGEYAVSRYPDRSPSDVFNTGFYAGVIAAREGLIDDDKIQHDHGDQLPKGQQAVEPRAE